MFAPELRGEQHHGTGCGMGSGSAALNPVSSSSSAGEGAVAAGAASAPDDACGRSIGRGARGCLKAPTKAMAFWGARTAAWPTGDKSVPRCPTADFNGHCSFASTKNLPRPFYPLPKIRAVTLGLCMGQAGLKPASAFRFGWLETMFSDPPCSFPWPTTACPTWAFSGVQVSKCALFGVLERC